MMKFALAIGIAILAANVLANSIDIEPAAGSNLDRANVIELAVSE